MINKMSTIKNLFSKPKKDCCDVVFEEVALTDEQASGCEGEKEQSEQEKKAE